jgi:hypothetical protein
MTTNQWGGLPEPPVRTSSQPESHPSGWWQASDGNWYPPQTHPTAGQLTPKRKGRIFRWVFLAAQLLFLIWIIAGLVSTGHPAHCQSLDQQTCQSAYNAGRGIGVGIIIFLWVAFDIIVGGTYAIWKLISRGSNR